MGCLFTILEKLNAEETWLRFLKLIASLKDMSSVAVIFLTSRWKSHSWQLRSVAMWDRWKKRYHGSVAWAEGQVDKEWFLSPQWLHLGLLRQNFEVWPKRKQLLHCKGERILEDTSKCMLKIERLEEIFGDKNLTSTMRVGVRIPSIRRYPFKSDDRNTAI